MEQKVDDAGFALFRPPLVATLVATIALCVGIWQPGVLQHQRGASEAPQRPVRMRSLASTVSPRQPQTAIDCAEQPCLALTFDDGPSTAITPQILDTLYKHHAHATFFVVGSHVAGNEQLLRRMYQEGHEIGNHSWSHADLTGLPLEQIDMQIQRTQAAVSAAGVPAPTLFRPPYGAVNALVKAHVPLTLAMWNVDPEDWHQKTAADVAVRIEASVRAGRVIDLHDIHQPTADALDSVLTDLESQYQLVTFSQLFNLAPGQRGMFYGR